MTAAIRALVRERAGNRCEYCQLHQEDSPLAALHIEHIRPIKHDGGNEESNLCLACIDCNLHKGPNLTGIDPLTDSVVSLFPRAPHVGHECLTSLDGRGRVRPAWRLR